jgi:hypothetical protein
MIKISEVLLITGHKNVSLMIDSCGDNNPVILGKVQYFLTLHACGNVSQYFRFLYQFF